MKETKKTVSVLATIAGVMIEVDSGTGQVSWRAGAQIDGDGGANAAHDPCWQPQTSLKDLGNSITADAVPFVVVPPQIIMGVEPVVLGCRATVTHTLTGQTVEAVVADIGPHAKIGEVSIACARALGINPDPNHGGESRRVINYVIYPGTPAVVNGTLYHLQPSNAR